METRTWLSCYYKFVSAENITILSVSSILQLRERHEKSHQSQKTYGMLQSAFRPSCMNRASVFERHKRSKEARESVRDDVRCGKSKEVNTPQLIGQRVMVRVTMLRF